jgi:hypothetical protein
VQITEIMKRLMQTPNDRLINGGIRLQESRIRIARMSRIRRPFTITKLCHESRVTSREETARNRRAERRGCGLS